jgi:hypothetical protein
LAGKRSVARSAIGEATVQFEKGLAQLQLMPESADRQQKELDLQCQLGSVRKAVGIFVKAAPRSGQAPDEVDHRGADLGRPLFLDDMAAAGQHDRTTELRHEFRHVGEVAVHAREFDSSGNGHLEEREGKLYAIRSTETEQRTAI